MGPSASKPPLEFFDTYYGLERIVATGDEMLRHMDQALADFSRNGFYRSVGKRRGEDGFGTVDVDYGRVWFADTFFSDTIDSKRLKSIFETSQRFRVPCRILLLNPFSDQARLRAVMLTADKAQAKVDKEEEVLELHRQALSARENWAALE